MWLVNTLDGSTVHQRTHAVHSHLQGQFRASSHVSVHETGEEPHHPATGRACQHQTDSWIPELSWEMAATAFQEMSSVRLSKCLFAARSLYYIN